MTLSLTVNDLLGACSKPSLGSAVFALFPPKIQLFAAEFPLISSLDPILYTITKGPKLNPQAGQYEPRECDEEQQLHERGAAAR